MRTLKLHNMSLIKEIPIVLVFLPVFLFCGCADTGADDQIVVNNADVPGEGSLTSGWNIGTLDDDLGVDLIWIDESYMSGSNVSCQSDGSVIIFVDEGGSEDHESNDLQSEAGGIIFAFDSLETIIGTYEVDVEVPETYPEWADGVSVAQTFGIFEKDPENKYDQLGASVNYGFCPGTGGHHISFGNAGEDISSPYSCSMGEFGGGLAMTMVDSVEVSAGRQSFTIMLEVKSDAIEFSIKAAGVADYDEPYYTYATNVSDELSVSDFELRIMTHAADVQFGTYDPEGAPYLTNIYAVRINGEVVPICE